MNKFVKKTAVKMATFAFALGMFGSVASAYGVTSADLRFLKSGSTPVTEASRNTTISAKGSVTYDATAWGWLPMPSTCHFYLETPSGSLNKPTSVSGTWSSGTFSYVSYSDLSENAVYRMYKTFGQFTGEVTKTATATVKTKSASTSYYNGCAGSGLGHDSDQNALCSFKTN